MTIQLKTITVLTFVLLVSCNKYHSISSNNNYKGGITVFESGSKAECKQKRQRIVIDDLIKNQVALVTKCNILEFEDGDCGIFSWGTFKGILEYDKNNIIIKQTIYKPVYDTFKLKLIYPELNEKLKHKLFALKSGIFELNQIDSLMIDRLILQNKTKKCEIDYLKTIKGFYLDSIMIRTDRIKKYRTFLTN